MGKVYFKYGTMGSGKSLDLIRTVYNYRERGKRAFVCKPSLDTRDGTDECVIRSRTGALVHGEWFDIKNLAPEKMVGYDIIIIDEAQFINECDISLLNKWTRLEEDYPSIIFYGLKTDFRGNLFSGVSAILAIADSIEETVSICSCGKKARQNVRYLNDVPVFKGEVVQVGGNESYGAVCNTCFERMKMFY